MHGKQVADFIIFIGCLVLFVLYHVYYFFRGVIFKGRSGILDLWTTARKTRTLWVCLAQAGALSGWGQARAGGACS